MENIQELLEFINEKKYGFGTGVWPIVNDKLTMQLNEFGEYITVLKEEYKDIKFSEEELYKLKQTSSVFSDYNVTDVSEELFSSIKNIKYNNKIGYYLNLYVGHVHEGEYRENGSSGGLGTWILKELLIQNYVDYVIHIKESKHNKKLFEYSISKTQEEIIGGSKTKYYPVELSEVLKIVKKTPGRYAVVGLPSYLMDLRLLSKYDSIIKERIKYTIGLVCGHQKSTFFGEFLAWQCGIKPENLKKINFRKKIPDVPAYSYAIEVEGEIAGKNTIITREMKSLIGSDWGQGLFKVRASDFIDDVMNETADLTLGDAWLPEYAKDSKGNNIIVVRNNDIETIINNAIISGKLVLDVATEDVIIESQLGHYRHTQEELAYRLEKKDRLHEWRPKLRFDPNTKIPFLRKKIQDKREEICLIAPLIFKEAVEKDDIDYFINKLTPLLDSYKKLYRIENTKIKVKRKIRKLIG